MSENPAAGAEVGMHSEPNSVWSIKQILDGLESGRYWLPHFQRGSVWSPEMALRLLDSLYLGTPCGSLVVWTPKANSGPSDWGVPITIPNSSSFQQALFLVDGQQRVRALRSGGEALGGPRVEERPLWLYLPGVPEWRGLPGTPRLRGLREGIFFRDVDIRQLKKPEVPRRERRGGGGASVLVEELRLMPSDEVKAHAFATKLIQSEVQYLNKEVEAVVPALIEVAKRLKLMPDRRFFVSNLVDFEFQDVVDVYNRINASGMRVDAAERAFAALTRSAPRSTPAGLRAVLSALHGTEETNPARPLDQRDQELKRKREEQLGFQFVLRLMAQALADEDWGALVGWMDFGTFHREDVIERLAHAERLREDHGFGHGVRETWTRCKVAAQALRSALVEELHCDDYRRIPRGGAARLQPILQLLVRFPNSAEGCLTPGPLRTQVAGLVLRRMLADLGNNRDETQLLEKIRRCASWAEGVRAIRTLPIEEGLKAFTAKEATTQARPAQLLYWLLRRPGDKMWRAEDFSYEANQVLKDQAVQKINVEVNPECQHMLPVSLVASVLDPNRSARGSGPTSRLGNLSWISNKFNSFEEGLGQSIIKLAHPLQVNENLASHVYDFVVDGRPAADAFERLSRMLEGQAGPTQAEFAKDYDKFCQARELEIVKRFEDWLTNLEADTEGMPVVAPALRVLPNGDLKDFEERVLDQLGLDDPRRALLLRIAVEVLRPALGTGSYVFHRHKTATQWYFLQKWRTGSKRWYGTDSAIRIDFENCELHRGELADVARPMFTELQELLGARPEEPIRLARLAQHSDAAIDVLNRHLCS